LHQTSKKAPTVTKIRVQTIISTIHRMGIRLELPQSNEYGAMKVKYFEQKKKISRSHDERPH
ncbi:MAG: hypothetical protein VX007_00590, partial [Pseudomonadota bacterium]|nr:hypothetical protein [Pseudomonadota bacterium]